MFATLLVKTCTIVGAVVVGGAVGLGSAVAICNVVDYIDYKVRS